MTFIAEHHQLLFLFACFCGLFMAWGIGANDVANAMGTSVGARALTIKQAILIAVVFEFAGAYLAGGEVTSTIRKGIIDYQAFSTQPELLVFGMIASMLAAALWLLIATSFGWPVSTTHSIVGAIIGFTLISLGADAIKWSKVGKIAASWVTSPALAGIVSFTLYKSVERFILNTSAPFKNAQRFVPVYMFLTTFMIAMVTFIKGLKHVGLDVTTTESIYYSIAFAMLVGIGGKLYLSRIAEPPHNTPDDSNHVERIFAVLMIVTACAMAFAHGSNDVANAIGPLAAVIGVLNSSGAVLQQSTVPSWALLLGATGIVIGLTTLGYKVIVTVGKKITELTPSRGFAAELAAACTVVLASGLGIPISTTHTLIGAILGVGIARGVSNINLGVVTKIITSWLVTLPAGAGFSIVIYLLLTSWAI
ncbi:MAG: inorganic phosphate transporter [Pseudomonadota bacterium]